MNREVAMDDLDTLQELSMELDMITYLQGLVYHDREEQAVVPEDFSHIHSYTHLTLWNRQVETTRRVRERLYHILFENKTDG